MTDEAVKTLIIQSSYNPIYGEHTIRVQNHAWGDFTRWIEDGVRKDGMRVRFDIKQEKIDTGPVTEEHMQKVRESLEAAGIPVRTKGEAVAEELGTDA